MTGFDVSHPEGVRLSSYVLRDSHLVKLAWLLPLCSVMGAVTLHVLLGNYRDVPFFISESDYPGIEGFVFTTGLFVSAGFQCLLALRLYVLFRRRAKTKTLLFATILGVASSSHLAVLAFANMYDYLSLHVYTSIIVFHGGFTWALLAHFSLPDSHPKGRRLRLTSLAIALVSLVVMTISIGRGVEQRSRELGVEPDMIPLNQLQPWVDVAAPAEFILFFALLGCLASFTWDILEQSDQFQNPSIES